MLIDWFTVGAQALNFLILVWLMKHFLYKPILDAIDARENGIAAKLNDAETKKTEAQKEQNDFQRKNEEFDKQRSALFTKATDEAKAENQRLLDEARKTADALNTKRQETLKIDEKALNQAISRRTQHEVFSIARKTLMDLSTTGLEERLGEVFTRRLREMNGELRNNLAIALKKTSEPALIRSAFNMPEKQRAVLQNALNETFASDIHVRFETAPELISGIELTANGQKLAWSISDYISSMEKSVGELLKEKSESKVDSIPPRNSTPDSKHKIALISGDESKTKDKTWVGPKVAPSIEKPVLETNNK